MKNVTMIGAHKRIVPGGFLVRRKRRVPSPRAVAEAAKQFLAGRIARNTDVHP